MDQEVDACTMVTVRKIGQRSVPAGRSTRHAHNMDGLGEISLRTVACYYQTLKQGYSSEKVISSCGEMLYDMFAMEGTF